MTARLQTLMALRMDKSELICVAAIAGAFGIKGEVKLKSFTDVPENCVNYGPLLSESGKVVLTPSSHRLVKDAVAITCPQVTTREQAEALKSTKLYVPRENFPAPEEDEFYASDLVGLDVKTTDGKRVGKITGVQDFGAGDLLEIKPKDSASFFHPFTLAAVPKVDIKAGRVVIKIEEAE
ncbi:MAG: ribosome maturation factor RimM [Hellea sp.]